MVITGQKLTAADVQRVAYGAEHVSLDPTQLEKVRDTYLRVQRWGEERHPIYGVNTGFGEMTHMIIPPEFKSELQCNLLRSHAAGGGAYFPDEIVRGMLVVRLNCLMKGHSGASVQTVELMREFLNRGICPMVPEQGSLGASGDLAPLSHLALPLIGDGEVRVRGTVKRSSAVLAEEGLRPIDLGFKEALALVNGTSAMTAVAALALMRARRLLRLAVLASADVVQCLGASTRAFDERGNRLKNHSGQVRVAAALSRLLEGNDLTREHRDIMRAITDECADREGVVNTTVYLQHAYTLRCVPQILGPAVESLEFCGRLIEEELNSANDNPLFFDTPDETFHGGNFHGQYVATACDVLNIAVTEIGVLAERQLNRLVDPHLNASLPQFLADGAAGLTCGFEGAQYLATSIASENLDLAAPASVKSIPSNGSNQDVVSMGLIAARKSLQITENVTTIIAVLIAACHQAALFSGPERFSAPVRRLHARLSAMGVDVYRDDYPIADLLRKARRMIDEDADWAEEDGDFTLEAADAVPAWTAAAIGAAGAVE